MTQLHAVRDGRPDCVWCRLRTRLFVRGLEWSMGFPTYRGQRIQLLPVRGSRLWEGRGEATQATHHAASGQTLVLSPALTCGDLPTSTPRSNFHPRYGRERQENASSDIVSRFLQFFTDPQILRCVLGRIDGSFTEAGGPFGVLGFGDQDVESNASLLSGSVDRVRVQIRGGGYGTRLEQIFLFEAQTGAAGGLLQKVDGEDGKCGDDGGAARLDTVRLLRDHGMACQTSKKAGRWSQ